MDPKTETSADPRLSETACGGDDFATLRRRLAESLRHPVDIDHVDGLARGLRSDGAWDDVNYKDQALATWLAYEHLGRVLELALATQAAGAKDHWLRAALSGLTHWLDMDYQNPNWWYNVIGVPRILGEIMALLDGELPADPRRKGLEILARTELGMTGANLVDVACVVLLHGALSGDAARVMRAIERTMAEIRVTADEGIQADRSFHQHGALLHNHGYGMALLTTAARMANVARGTAFAVSDATIGLLSSLVLDGCRWMIRYGTLDYSATGRGMTRPQSDDRPAYSLRTLADLLLALDRGRGDEWRNLQAHLNRDESLPPHNRHFWRSDFMSHGRPAFYASVRMHSKRTHNNDWACNNEGHRLHHVADGCTYLMRTGREYENIFPLWDMRRIPGATVSRRSDLHVDAVRRQGTTDFVGGVSDGRFGAAAFDFERDGVTARKAWFGFDSQVVCLGTGIANAGDGEVETTLNQCWRNGPILAATAAGWQAVPENALPGSPIAVYHDGMVYRLLEAGDLRLETRHERRSWGHLNEAFEDVTAEGEVFTLWLAHGANPRGQGYAYAVSPLAAEATVAEAETLSPSSARVLSNTSACQAAHDAEADVLGAVFYKAGRVDLPDGGALQVDQPCLALLRRTSRHVDLSLSNPCNQPLTVEALYRQDDGGVSRAITFDLPNGQEAGRSITQWGLL